MEHEPKINCTVYIMTLNSGPNFKRTLESVQQFGEILVCDGNSTDGTPELARAMGARVIKQSDSTLPNQKITDFAAVHNKCRVEARYDWIFQLDHDEIMPPETAEEINQVILTYPIEHYIFQVPNRIIWRGRLIKYSSTYPGYELRFFNRLSGAVYIRNPHSRITFDNHRYSVGFLKNPFIAYDEGEPDMGWKYIKMEIGDARQQSWHHFWYWTVYRRIRAMGIIIVKSVWIRLRYGTTDTLPIRFDLYRLGHAWYVLTGTVQERFFGFNPSKNVPAGTKKILLVSEKRSIFYRPVAQSLKSLGYWVETLDPKKSLILKPGGKIHRAIIQLPFAKRSIERAHANFNDKLLKFAKEFQPQIILALKAKSIDTKTLDALRSIGTLINWYPDTMDNWESIQRIAPHYSYFFCYDRYIVEKLKKEKGLTNCYHLPFAADIDQYTPWPVGERRYPVSFLGSYHPKRYSERLMFLSEIKDLGLHLWGNQAWKKTSLDTDYLGPVSPDLSEIMDIYRNSKIVVHMDLMTDIFPGTGVTLRPFDVTASGALLIAHDGRIELGELFENGKEFISFHTKEEFRKSVEHYLKHDEERVRIARSGFDKTRTHHSYHMRLRELLAIAYPQA